MATNINVDSNLTDYEATSTSSHTMVSGAKTFTIETGKKFNVGDLVEFRPVGAKLPGGFRMTLTAADPVAGTVTATAINTYSFDTPVWATTIAAGTITTVTNPGLSLVATDTVRLVRRGTPATFAAGTVTSYNSTTGDLVMSTTSTGGSGSQTDLVLVSEGTFSNWQISYAENDVINILTNSTLTISSNPKVPLGNFASYDRGTVELVNTSTTSMLDVEKSMYAHTNFDYFTGQSTFRARGDFITIGTGDNSANQTIDISSYGIDIPSYIEMETGNGTGVYKQVYISADGYTGIAEGFTGPTVPGNWGYGDPTDDDKYWQGAICWYNPTTKVLKFGDGVNGNKIPTGAKVRMPNIYYTQQRPYFYAANTITSSDTTLQVTNSVILGATTGDFQCKSEGLAFTAKPTATSLTITRGQRLTVAGAIDKGDKCYLVLKNATSGNYRLLRFSTDAGGKIDVDKMMFGYYYCGYIYNPREVIVKNTGVIGAFYPQYSPGPVTFENTVSQHFHWWNGGVGYTTGFKVSYLLGKVDIYNVYAAYFGESGISVDNQYFIGLFNIERIYGVYCNNTPTPATYSSIVRIQLCSFNNPTKRVERIVGFGAIGLYNTSVPIRDVATGVRPNPSQFPMMNLTADNTTDTFTITSYKAGSQEPFTGATFRIYGGTAPTGLVVGTMYYMIRVSATQFQLATTFYNAMQGTAINFTTNGASLTGYTLPTDTFYGFITTNYFDGLISKVRSIGAAGYSYYYYFDPTCKNIKVYDTIVDSQEWTQYFLYSAGKDVTIANADFGKMRNGNTLGATVNGQNGGISIATARGVVFDNIRKQTVSPIVGTGYGLTYGSGYTVQMTAAPSMYWVTSAASAIVSNGLDVGPMYNLLDSDATTGNIYVGGFGLNDVYNLVATTGTAYLDNLGRVYLPTTGDTAVITSQITIRGVTSFQNLAPTITSTNPANLTYTFRVKTPTGTWSTPATLDGTNLSTALSSLTGYDSNIGFDFEITVTAVGTSATTKLDFIKLATNTDNSYKAYDGYLYPAGADTTDVVECRLISDNSLIGSTVGNNKLEIYASDNFEQQAYLVRKTAGGVEINRTQNNPFTVNFGNNGTINLYSGDQVQLAQSPDVTVIKNKMKGLLTLGQFLALK